MASQVALVIKNPLANAEDIIDMVPIPGTGRSHGEGYGNPLQGSCLENPTDRWVWQATVHAVPQGPGWSDLAWMHIGIYIDIYIYIYIFVVVVQSFSRVQLFETNGLQHVRLPCPSPSPGACSNSCPLSWWCHPTISSSVAPFSSCLLSFPASVSRLFTSGGQSIGASAPASVLPVDIQNWFPFELTGLISLQSKGLSRVFFNTTVQKHQFFGAHPCWWSNSPIHTWVYIYTYIYFLLQCFAGISFPGGWASANLSTDCVSAESALFWYVCVCVCVCVYIYIYFFYFFFLIAARGVRADFLASLIPQPISRSVCLLLGARVGRIPLRSWGSWR